MFIIVKYVSEYPSVSYIFVDFLYGKRFPTDTEFFIF